MLSSAVDTDTGMPYNAGMSDRGTAKFQWLNAKEVAEATGYSLRTVRRLANEELADAGLAVLKSRRWWFYPDVVGVLNKRKGD